MKTSIRLNPHLLVLNGLTALIIFNVPLSRFFPNLYYLAVGLIGSYLAITSFFYGKTRINNVSLFFILYTTFVVALFTIQVFTGSSPGLSLGIKSMVSLLWIPTFYIFFSSFLKEVDLEKFMRWQIWMAWFVGILGYVQFFGSTDLYGWLPESKKWIAVVENGSIGLRTYSVLNSGQVFGLFSIIYAVITIENRNTFRSKVIPFLVVLTLFGASLLSGNKSSTVLFMLYVLFKLLSNKTIAGRLALFGSGLFLVILVLFPPNLSNQELTGIPSIDRSLGWISNFNSLGKDKSNQDRLNVYTENLARLKLFTGNGVGCTAPNQEGIRLITSESYYLKILMEGGIVSFLLFLVFIVGTLKHLIRQKRKKALAIFSLVLTSMVFVQAFSSPAFFGVWGYIIFELNRDNTV
ncbi:hypothetical protein [Roseivirga sp. E12]|uniref:hypothetical protein n=1 Tax=Roseivirga sp. E12 TaxID=2819237 RepID=UPI001ABCD404|nr:hypothetical protein [Roseivirga sp. E12]MBO3700884.1 hypothetical protein [Roseivirga sp. E12]